MKLLEDTENVALKSGRINDGLLSVDLWYPRSGNELREVEVSLMDVRAADSIRVSYDFERDGYIVKQASTFEWAYEDKVCDEDWQEVAFIKAWARYKNPLDAPEETS